MGFMAAAIPIVADVLGSMSKEEEKPQAAIPPPPTLGEMFALNAQNYSEPRQYAMPSVGPFTPNSPVGGGAK
jgi:hypothetical protein